MEKIMILSSPDFILAPDRKEVYEWLACPDTLPCRQAYEKRWDQAAELLEQTSVPTAVLIRENKLSLYVFVTIGLHAEKKISALFSNGEYITANLLNTLCDQRLFQIDRQTASRIKAELETEHLFLADRKDPGEEELPQEAEKRFASIKAVLPWAGISKSGILSPTKSMLYRMELSDQPCSTDTLHDCSVCGQKDCLYRDKAYRTTDR